MSEPKSTYGEVEELIDLIKSYVKQETVDPLRTLGKRFGLGLAAAIAYGTAAVFFTLGFLRAVDRFFGFASRGVLSAVPYIIAVLLLAVTLFIVWSRQSGGESNESSS